MNTSLSCATHRWIAGATIALLLAISQSQGQEIKFEKYQLPNGLTVILHVDHTLPQATINLWYGVGARNEPPGRSGFAHLFEHLMFMGTRRVPNGSFDTLMEAQGGSNNASTSLERTNYFSSGPSSLLPTLLWLDADRMEDLGRATDQTKLDRQRDIVRNEIRQVAENQPYAKAYEASFRLMYPIGHPYHNAVYGTHEDLEAATVQNVRDFFATFYCAGNCSLVVAGDFDPAVIKPLIDKLYGPLPRGNASARQPVPKAKLDRVQRATFLDDVSQPQIEFVYHSPGRYEAGDGELDIVGQILTAGANSRLYKRLVMDEELASDVSAGQESALDTSLFRVTVTAKPGADLSRIEKEMDEEIAKLATAGPTDAEVKQRANTLEMGMLADLQSLSARADILNQYEFFMGTPDGLKRDLDRYRNATPAIIRDVTQRVLTPDARLIMQILPQALDTTASALDTRPPDLAAPKFAPPMPEIISLSNGVKVQVWNRPAMPLVSMALVVVPGHPVESVKEAGLSSLLADMTQQGAGNLDAGQFANAQQTLGAEINADADADSVSLSLSVLKRNFAPAAALLADAALRPMMKQPDFDREKALALDDIDQDLDKPDSVAWRVASRMYFGDADRRSIPGSGTPESVKALTLDAIKAQRAKLIRPDIATVLVAGDITPDEAKAALEPLLGASAWPASAATADESSKIAPAKAQATSGLRVYLVDRPAAVQTVLTVFGPGVPFGSDRRVGLELVNTVLGGSFTSRLNQNIREAHGYAYGASSGSISLANVGLFHASTSVKADVTGDGLKELINELKRIGTADLTEAEATKARETRRNNLIQSYESIGLIVQRAKHLLVIGAPPDAPAKELAMLAAADLTGMKDLSKSLVNLDGCVLVLVGDKAKVLPQIAPLGLPKPVEVDALGNVVAK